MNLSNVRKQKFNFGAWILDVLRSSDKNRDKTMSKILDYPNLSPLQRQAQMTVAIEQSRSEAAHAAKVAREQRELDEKKLADLARQHAFHRAEREKQLAAEAKLLRRKESENLDATIRERYFAANSFALESDYLRDKDKLRSEYMLERVEKRKTAEEMLRATSIKM